MTKFYHTIYWRILIQKTIATSVMVTRAPILIRYPSKKQAEMDIRKATYSHDHEKIAEFLDSGGVLDAASFCNLVLFDSKSETLQAGNFGLVARAMKLGADPNGVPFDGHASPIDLACGSPNSETVELLLKSGAIASPSSTPHCAIEDDLDQNLSMLIRFGIDMTTPMKNDDPDDEYAPVPFQYAKDLKSKKCLKVLTDHLAK